MSIDSFKDLRQKIEANERREARANKIELRKASANAPAAAREPPQVQSESSHANETPQKGTVRRFFDRTFGRVSGQRQSLPPQTGHVPANSIGNQAGSIVDVRTMTKETLGKNVTKPPPAHGGSLARQAGRAPRDNTEEPLKGNDEHSLTRLFAPRQENRTEAGSAPSTGRDLPAAPSYQSIVTEPKHMSETVTPINDVPTEPLERA